MFKGLEFSFESPWMHWIGIAFVLFIMFLFARRLTARGVAQISRPLGAAFSALLVRVVRKTNTLLLLLLAGYASAQWTSLTTSFEKVLSQALVVGLIAQCGIWASVFADQWFSHYAEKKQAKDPSSLTAFGLLSFASRMLIWLVVVLIILENQGVNISALVAGLGIGGVAVALAVQNILGDLLGSLSIILDKPFVVGDTILVGDITGTVERIGVKTTHLRALSGEQVIITNSDLLGSRIRNFKRMNERRIAFTIGVTYDTSYQHVEAIPSIIREIVEAQTPVRFDRAHFKSLGDSALLFEIVYFVLSADFQVYMDIQQRVNLALLKKFQEIGVEFAFPTQTFVMKGAIASLGK